MSVRTKGYFELLDGLLARYLDAQEARFALDFRFRRVVVASSDGDQCDEVRVAGSCGVVAAGGQGSQADGIPAGNVLAGRTVIRIVSLVGSAATLPTAARAAPVDCPNESARSDHPHRLAGRNLRPAGPHRGPASVPRPRGSASRAPAPPSGADRVRGDGAAVFLEKLPGVPERDGRRMVGGARIAPVADRPAAAIRGGSRRVRVSRPDRAAGPAGEAVRERASHESGPRRRQGSAELVRAPRAECEFGNSTPVEGVERPAGPRGTRRRMGSADAERDGALLNLAVVRDHRHRLVPAGRPKR